MIVQPPLRILGVICNCYRKLDPRQLFTARFVVGYHPVERCPKVSRVIGMKKMHKVVRDDANALKAQPSRHSAPCAGYGRAARAQPVPRYRGGRAVCGARR